MNHEIRARRVLVIDEHGARLGEFRPADALALAEERGLDLVEVAPDARPPVCRICDWDRMRYQRRVCSRRPPKTKEVRLRPKTGQHDLDVVVRKALKFLRAGHSVEVVLRFRGREHAHRDLGRAQCIRLAEAVAEVGTVESAPAMHGRRMTMLLRPS